MKKSRSASSTGPIERGRKKWNTNERVTISGEFLKRSKVDRSPKTVSPYSKSKIVSKALNTSLSRKKNYGSPLSTRNLTSKVNSPLSTRSLTSKVNSPHSTRSLNSKAKK